MLKSIEVDACDMVDVGETIVTEIVLFQPEPLKDVDPGNSMKRFFSIEFYF